MKSIDLGIRYAQQVAARYGVRLGDCLFAQDISETGWAFQFGMVDGPTGWTWVVLFTEIGADVLFYAKRNRRPACIAPRIRRGRLFFSRSYW
jgi:hypothetical protein